jgi:hypothetical protein
LFAIFRRVHGDVHHREDSALRRVSRRARLEEEEEEEMIHVTLCTVIINKNIPLL